MEHKDVKIRKGRLKDKKVKELAVHCMTCVRKINRNLEILDIKDEDINYKTQKANHIFYMGAKTVYDHIISELIKILKDK